MLALLYLWSSAFAACEESHQLPVDIEAAKQGVVVVENGDATGSGVIIDDSGMVLTAAHVVGDADTVSVSLTNRMSFTAAVIRRSSDIDLALLQLPAGGVPCLALATERSQVGSDVYALGAPAGPQLAASVSRGVVSGFPTIANNQYLHTDASVSPGSSGGPILDTRGQIQGIVSFKHAGEGFEGLGFGILSEDASAWLHSDASLDFMEEATQLVDQDAARAEFVERAVWYRDFAGVNQNGQTVSTWSIPQVGKYGDPLRGGEFYDYVGAPHLARKYRRSMVVKTSVGLTGVGAMLGGTALALGTATRMTCDTTDYERCQRKNRRHIPALTTGISFAGVGLVMQMVGLVWDPHPIKPNARRRLSDEFNDDLVTELGIIVDD